MQMTEVEFYLHMYAIGSVWVLLTFLHAFIIAWLERKTLRMSWHWRRSAGKSSAIVLAQQYETQYWKQTALELSHLCHSQKCTIETLNRDLCETNKNLKAEQAKNALPRGL